MTSPHYIVGAYASLPADRDEQSLYLSLIHI